VSWLRRLVAGFSALRTAFIARPVRVGSLMDTVPVGQVLLRILRFPYFGGRLERCVQRFGGKMRERDNWGDTVVDESIILRLIVKK
jgi:hypothetical protein